MKRSRLPAARLMLCGSLLAAALASAPALAADATPAASVPAAVTAPSVTAAASTTSTTAAAPVRKPATAPKARPGAAVKPDAGPKQGEHIELDTTQITGNKELPKVMYVVPWKKADMGDFGGRPAKSLLDEVLAPVDRDVFKRQTRYYDALQPDAAAGSAAGAAAGNEK